MLKEWNSDNHQNEKNDKRRKDKKINNMRSARHQKYQSEPEYIYWRNQLVVQGKTKSTLIGKK